MKKQTGLTIIKLMILLFIAGIVGSALLSALIKHRCVTDPGALSCTEKSASTGSASTHVLITQTPGSPA